jgi:hypothetical protein
MNNFHNIEKLPGKAHYTGYAEGLVFHIYRVNGKWRAHCPNNGGGAGEIFYRRTLAEVSAKLVARGVINRADLAFLATL